MVDDASKGIWWRRFLDQATSLQKLLLALGGIATAVLAIGALVVAVGNLVEDDDTDRSTPGGVGALADLDGTTIRSKTAEADELIAGLLAVAASESKSVHLGVKVLADASQPALDSADIKVYFNCSPGPCSEARLQFPRDEGVETNPLGFDLTGSWEVRLARGVDFQSKELDISLQRTSGS